MPRTTSNTNRQGAQFERRIARILTDEGYRVVRSSASRGPYDLNAEKALEAEGYRVVRPSASRDPYAHHDLNAEKPGQYLHLRLLVQCKYTGRGLTGVPKVDPADWNALYQAALDAGALAILAARPAPRMQPIFWRITGFKAGVKGVPSPCEVFYLDEVDAAFRGLRAS